MSSAVPLIYTLNTIPTLSTLNTFINSSSKLTNLFSTSNNFTFLAPTNDAWSSYIASNGNQTMDVIEATLEYHLLNGSFPTVSFTEAPQFPSTSLHNQSFENVTIYPPGQRVELLTSTNGPQFLSSNKTVSNVVQKDIICLGGIIQVVNNLLRIPTSFLNLFTQANLNYFIALLNQANFLAVNDAGLIGFVNNVTFTPNVTFLVPNSAATLAQFTSISKGLSADQLLELFNYHIIYDFVGYSSVLTNGTTVKTAQGNNIIFTRDAQNNLFANQARITTADYLTVNGVFHVIDAILDRNNISIPASIPRASATAIPSPSSDGGLSTGAIVAIAVVIPIVVLAALAGFLFWFLRRRKQRRSAAASDPTAELHGSHPSGPPGELSGADHNRELAGDDAKKELEAQSPRGELEAKHLPTELPSPPPPVELDAGFMGQPIRRDDVDEIEQSPQQSPHHMFISPVSGGGRSGTGTGGDVTPMRGDETPVRGGDITPLRHNDD